VSYLFFQLRPVRSVVKNYFDPAILKRVGQMRERGGGLVRTFLAFYYSLSLFFLVSEAITKKRER